MLAAVDGRPNLVATLGGQNPDGPTLVYLGHVDTVLADPSEWQHDPWSGQLADGFLWGRGSLDMKSQVAAEAVAAVSMARDGWRPVQGALKLAKKVVGTDRLLWLLFAVSALITAATGTEIIWVFLLCGIVPGPVGRSEAAQIQSLDRVAGQRLRRRRARSR